jgi:2-polyprenyl-6-methoxyphenol hydroxylase-like FAD-dependent oxidoreductase
LPLLEVIGARDCIERAGFLRLRTIIVWWSEAGPVTSTLPAPGFHVDREEFDRLLLQNARANGVRVLQPAQAMAPERLSGGGWRIRLRRHGSLKEVIAPLVVDASGDRNILSGRRFRVSAPLLAVYARWSGVDGDEAAGRVEAGENEWFWYAPLAGGGSIAAVFLDPKRLSGTAPHDIEATYRELLSRCRLFRGAPTGSLEGPVKACDASSRYAAEAAAPDFVKVGDANLSLDPLSSQGVQSGIASAIQAAVVVNTLARRPQSAQPAIAFYHDRQKEKIRQYAAKTAASYQERAAVCDRPFWRRRAVFQGEMSAPDLEREPPDCNCQVQLSRQVKIEGTPTIQGDIVVSAPALHHSTLDRPVAFLDDVNIIPLLSQVGAGQTIEAIVQGWSEQLTVDLSWRIMQWLWQRKIVVPVSADERGHRRDDAERSKTWEPKSASI